MMDFVSLGDVDRILQGFENAEPEQKARPPRVEQTPAHRRKQQLHHQDFLTPKRAVGVHHENHASATFSAGKQKSTSISNKQIRVPGTPLIARLVSGTGTGCCNVIQLAGGLADKTNEKNNTTNKGITKKGIWSTNTSKNPNADCTVEIATKLHNIVAPKERGEPPGTRYMYDAKVHVVIDNAVPTISKCEVFGGQHPITGMRHLTSVPCFNGAGESAKVGSVLHKQSFIIDGRLLQPYLRLSFKGNIDSSGLTASTHRIVFLSIVKESNYHVLLTEKPRSETPSRKLTHNDLMTQHVRGSPAKRQPKSQNILHEYDVPPHPSQYTKKEPQVNRRNQQQQEVLLEYDEPLLDRKEQKVRKKQPRQQPQQNIIDYSSLAVPPRNRQPAQQELVRNNNGNNDLVQYEESYRSQPLQQDDEEPPPSDSDSESRINTSFRPVRGDEDDINESTHNIPDIHHPHQRSQSTPHVITKDNTNATNGRMSNLESEHSDGRVSTLRPTPRRENPVTAVNESPAFNYANPAEDDTGGGFYPAGVQAVDADVYARHAAAAAQEDVTNRHRHPYTHRNNNSHQEYDSYSDEEQDEEPPVRQQQSVPDGNYYPGDSFREHEHIAQQHGVFTPVVGQRTRQNTDRSHENTQRRRRHSKDHQSDAGDDNSGRFVPTTQPHHQPDDFPHQRVSNRAQPRRLRPQSSDDQYSYPTKNGPQPSVSHTRHYSDDKQEPVVGNHQHSSSYSSYNRSHGTNSNPRSDYKYVSRQGSASDLPPPAGGFQDVSRQPTVLPQPQPHPQPQQQQHFDAFNGASQSGNTNGSNVHDLVPQASGFVPGPHEVHSEGHIKTNGNLPPLPETNRSHRRLDRLVENTFHPAPVGHQNGVAATATTAATPPTHPPAVQNDIYTPVAQSTPQVNGKVVGSNLVSSSTQSSSSPSSHPPPSGGLDLVSEVTFLRQQVLELQRQLNSRNNNNNTNNGNGDNNTNNNNNRDTQQDGEHVNDNGNNVNVKPKHNTTVSRNGNHTTASPPAKVTQQRIEEPPDSPPAAVPTPPTVEETEIARLRLELSQKDADLRTTREKLYKQEEETKFLIVRQAIQQAEAERRNRIRTHTYGAVSTRSPSAGSTSTMRTLVQGGVPQREVSPSLSLAPAMPLGEPMKLSPEPRPEEIETRVVKMAEKRVNEMTHRREAELVTKLRDEETQIERRAAAFAEKKVMQRITAEKQTNVVMNVLGLLREVLEMKCDDLSANRAAFNPYCNIDTISTVLRMNNYSVFIFTSQFLKRDSSSWGRIFHHSDSLVKVKPLTSTTDVATLCRAAVTQLDRSVVNKYFIVFDCSVKETLSALSQTVTSHDWFKIHCLLDFEERVFDTHLRQIIALSPAAAAAEEDDASAALIYYTDLTSQHPLLPYYSSKRFNSFVWEGHYYSGQLDTRGFLKLTIKEHTPVIHFWERTTSAVGGDALPMVVLLVNNSLVPYIANDKNDFRFDALLVSKSEADLLKSILPVEMWRMVQRYIHVESFFDEGLSPEMITSKILELCSTHKWSQVATVSYGASDLMMDRIFAWSEPYPSAISIFYSNPDDLALVKDGFRLFPNTSNKQLLSLPLFNGA